MLISFVGLLDVPFEIYSCGRCCDEIKENLIVKQKELRESWQSTHEAEMQKAREELQVNNRHTDNNTTHTVKRNNDSGSKCSLM